MDQGEKFRKEEALRLLKWIEQNPSEWFGITLAYTDEDMLSGKELKDMIRSLKENGFYSLLILLVYVRNDIIKRAMEKSLLQFIQETWNEKSLDRMVAMLVDNIE